MTEKKSPLKRALDLSSNKIVSACAGAGKTFALSKRYCKIIDEFTKHNLQKPKNEWLGFKNILVITFTNKAAAEMSKRIYQDLHMLLQGEEIPELNEQEISLGEHIRTAPEKYKNWLRSTFSQNCIMTIDSFCGTILRENAFLLGIDPQFKTSDELLAQKLYRETLNDFLNRQSKELRPELKNILQFTDKNGIIQFFNYFEHKNAFLENWLEFMETQSVEEIYLYWLENYLPQFDVEALIEKVRNIIPYHVHIKQDGKNFLAELKIKIEEIPEESEPERRRYFMAEVLPFFLTNKNTYYKKAWSVQTKKSFIKPALTEQFKDRAETILELIPQYIPEEQVLLFPAQEDIKSISVFKDLITLYSEFEDALWTTQLQKNYLTFNDVIIRTRELLRENNSICERYAAQFQHILVDEFQDTNNLRWEIIKHIATGPNSRIRRKGVFIVGDKKQSIYRFQQADVEVMNRAREELENVADEVLIEFNDNYRSSKKYIEHVINPLFRKIFTPPEFPFEASFEETTFPVSKSHNDIDEITGNVCDISIVRDMGNGTIYTPALHAAYTAKKYLEWAESRKLPDPVVIGVLLRNFIHINDYLRAFQEFEIPFQIIGEKNLFNQQEAYDLFHFIGIIINPHDDAALIGLLRSPFFCAPDTLIYNCKNRKKDESIFSYISRNESYQEIVLMINSWRQLAQTKPITYLVENILTEDNREFGYIGEIGGTQHLANIDKLIRLVADLGLDGSNVQDIYDYLSYQIHYKSEVPQADLPMQAKVQIMTIHKAKGLEFPAVIIPDLNNIKTETQRGNIFHSRIIEQGQIEVGISVKEGVDAKKSNFLEIIKKRDLIEQSAEDKRMFYVAVTRAKYRVALLADIQGSVKKTSWFNDFVIKPLELAVPSEDEEPLSISPPSFWNYKLLTADELRNNLDQNQNTEMHKDWNPPLVQETYPRYKKVTPHDLMKSVFVQQETYREDVGDHNNELDLAFGSIFHSIIEKEWWDWNVRKDSIKHLIEITFPAISFADIEDKLKLHLEHFSTSDIYSLLQQASKQDVFHEHHITGWLDNGELFLEVNGVIDLLIKIGKQWYIVDFKTDRTTSNYEAYVLQLQTYVWIVKQLYDIDAKALIYYSATNTLKEVPFPQEYFSEIFPDEEHPFRPSVLEDFGIDEKLLSIVSAHKPLIIINLTDYHSKKILQALACKKMLTPTVKTTTLHQVIAHSSHAAKRLTPDIARILTKKASGQYSVLDGTIELLSEAFYEHFMTGKDFVSSHHDFEEIYQNFESLRKSYHYLYDTEILDHLIETEFRDTAVLLNGLFKDSKADFISMQKLSRFAKDFYYIDNFNKDQIENGFDHSFKIWNNIHPEKPDSQTVCNLYYSIETEVEGIAQQILEYNKIGIPFSKIRMAISSIDAYVPMIEKIFKEYGIPYRVLAPTPIINHPLTSFLSGLLTIMLSSEHLTWQTLSSVLLHPLFEDKDKFYTLDAQIRMTNIKFFSDIVHLPDVQKYSETIHIISDMISELRLDSHNEKEDDLLDKFSAFFHVHELDRKIEHDDMLGSVFSRLHDIIRNIVEAYSLLDIHHKNDDTLKEIKKQFKKAELPRREGDNGVLIISYLETYNVSEEILFVAGLADNYFPVHLKRNPFTKSIPHYEWQRSALLLNGWVRNTGMIHLSYPQHAMNGDTLNPSILLEDYKQKEIHYENPAHPITLRQYYPTFDDKMINSPTLPILQRHNDYLEQNVGPFTGQVCSDGSNRIITSASRMNHLIQCPMRYLFEDILQLKPLQYDEDAELRMQLGNVIHAALEQFGRNDGFLILEKNFQQSCAMLFSELENALKSHHISIERDLFLQRLYSPYLEGLKDADENNLLVQLLQVQQDYFRDYTPIIFEQEFGMHKRKEQTSWPILEIKNDVVILHFWGKIDKILLKENRSQIIGSDYKTGSAPHAADINNFWDVQPFIYFFALQEHYPDKSIRFVYESTKNHAKSLLTINFENDECHIKTSRSEYPRSQAEIIKILLHYGEKVVNGTFQIRERELGSKPCGYCMYEKLCRKNSQRNVCKDITNILQTIIEEK